MVQYLAPIPEVERGDLMSAYYRRLTGNDDKVKQECATAWSVLYLSLSLSLSRPGRGVPPCASTNTENNERSAMGHGLLMTHAHDVSGLAVSGR